MLHLRLLQLQNAAGRFEGMGEEGIDRRIRESREHTRPSSRVLSSSLIHAKRRDPRHDDALKAVTEIHFVLYTLYSIFERDSRFISRRQMRVSCCIDFYLSNIYDESKCLTNVA